MMTTESKNSSRNVLTLVTVNKLNNFYRCSDHNATDLYIDGPVREFSGGLLPRLLRTFLPRVPAVVTLRGDGLPALLGETQAFGGWQRDTYSELLLVSL